MKLSIDCEKCGAIYHIKLHTTKPHNIVASCPFCGKQEAIEVNNAKAKI